MSGQPDTGRGLSVSVEHEVGRFRLSAAFAATEGVTALFGPSGSGKTTLVNVIAGLLRPGRGRIVLDGVPLLDAERRIVVPRHRRRIGYVFQEGRLFPHLTVRQNLLYGHRFAPRDPSDREGPTLDAVLALLGIEALLPRRPADLSGGEKQRVAIGRALLSRPRLLLMDEPLASLDAGRKAEILPFLERLRDEARVPIVYVSHALEEVARLATTLVLLEKGRVVASGDAAALFARLDLPMLAGASSGGAVLEARILSHDPAFGLSTLSTQAGALTIPGLDLSVGASLRVQIHARDVMLSLGRPEGVSALNVLSGTVAEIAPSATAPSADIRLDCGGAAILARITRKSLADLALAPGYPIFAVVKSVSLARGGTSDT